MTRDWHIRRPRHAIDVRCVVENDKGRGDARRLVIERTSRAGQNLLEEVAVPDGDLDPW